MSSLGDETPAVNGRRRTRRDTEAGSVAYAVAGEAMRDVLRRAARLRISAFDRRVLDVVLAFTVSYSKLADVRSSRQIAQEVYCREELVGWERENTTKALKHLAELGLIEYAPRRGPYARSRIAVAPSPSNVAPRTHDVVVPFTHDETANVGELLGDRGSNHSGNVVQIAATASNDCEKSPLGRDDEVLAKTEAVIERITQQRFRDARGVRDGTAYRAAVRRKIEGEIDVDHLRAVIMHYPDAPIDVLAGEALREPTSLRFFRRIELE
jgi:hypothetical protein